MSQQMNIYLKKCKSMIAILVGALLVLIFLLSKIIPMAQEISKLKKDYSDAVVTLSDKERTLADLKKKAEAEAKNNNDQLKEFYKPIEQGMDTEAVIANEFAEIFELLRANSVKTRSIQYEYEPQDDNFVKNAAAQYHVAKLDSEMIATYKNFEGFLKELYKHEHFVDISSIEVVPYDKDKKILIIKFQMKLYAQK